MCGGIGYQCLAVNEVNNSNLEKCREVGPTAELGNCFFSCGMERERESLYFGLESKLKEAHVPRLAGLAVTDWKDDL